MLDSTTLIGNIIPHASAKQQGLRLIAAALVVWLSPSPYLAVVNLMKPALPAISAERQRALRSKVATAVRRDRENDLRLVGVDRSLDRRRLRDVGHHSANLHELRIGILRRLELDSRELPERNIISK